LKGDKSFIKSDRIAINEHAHVRKISYNPVIKKRQILNKQIILGPGQFFAEEKALRALEMYRLQRLMKKTLTYKVVCRDRSASVLVFDVDALAPILKTEDLCINELAKSYRHKVPNSVDSIPRFSDLYKKVFASSSVRTSVDMSLSILPSQEVRATMLKGRELDRREEIDQIIHDFPKINVQRILIEKSQSPKRQSTTFDRRTESNSTFADKRASF
jgi:hypothetical protein